MVTDYQTTAQVEEALSRLTEAYLALGIVTEAQTAAAVLGHNYPDSNWYRHAYGLLGKQGLKPQARVGSWITQTWNERRQAGPDARAMLARPVDPRHRSDRQARSRIRPRPCVLTGETGAGKSILLDAFGLALGGRGDAALVRHGAVKGR